MLFLYRHVLYLSWFTGKVINKHKYTDHEGDRVWMQEKGSGEGLRELTPTS